jgi:hypothetical protein
MAALLAAGAAAGRPAAGAAPHAALRLARTPAGMLPGRCTSACVLVTLRCAARSPAGGASGRRPRLSQLRGKTVAATKVRL